MRWKPIAWNGIRFEAPADWQIGVIDTRHLVLEASGGPVLEARWGRVRGRFSHAAHLKRLAARLPRGASGGFERWELPEDWRRAVGAFEAAGFRWRAGAERGQGVVLHCPACKTASLVQFFSHRLPEFGQVAPRVLRSFADHQDAGGQMFSVFDVRATVPVPFALEGFRFEPGRFQLAFTHRRNRLAFHRWALAAIALGAADLADFGRRQGLFAPGPVAGAKAGPYTAVEQRRAARGVEGLRRRLRAAPRQLWCRIWHVAPADRILAVAAETRRPLDEGLFDRICAHYEIL